MRLSPPKFVVFIIAFLLGGVAIASKFVAIPFVNITDTIAFWALAIGFVLLVLGNVFRGF